jgi:hypothetical protein
MATCYLSRNDVSGLTAESLQLDDANDYEITGDQIAIGSGGLTATPTTGPAGPAGDLIEVPLQLSASQKWSITGRGSLREEAGLALAGGVSAAGRSLEVELSDEPSLWFAANDTEVGPITLRGQTASKPGVLNGAVFLLYANLNSLDGHPVSLSHIYLWGSGAVGALTTTDAEIEVGSPAASIEAGSATLDSASEIAFSVVGTGSTARNDYSQLVSHGPIELNSAKIAVVVQPPKQGASCPVPTPGATYTFVSTTGALSGTFANAPEHGAEIPIRFAESCAAKPAQKIRISYHESGAAETVTGTVEEEAAQRKEREAAAKRKQEEEAASRRKEEEAAAKRRQEEAAAAKAFAPVQELPINSIAVGPLVPDARLASTALDVTASGTVKVRISCPVAESRCVGTVSLRTLNAVDASIAGTAKSKAAVLTLAIGSFSVAGGKVATVILHLSAKARSLLARSHSLRIRVTILARDPAGARHTEQTIVTLHAPAIKRGTR